MVSNTRLVPRCCVAMANSCVPLLESLSTIVIKTGGYRILSKRWKVEYLVSVSDGHKNVSCLITKGSHLSFVWRSEEKIQIYN